MPEDAAKTKKKNPTSQPALPALKRRSLAGREADRHENIGGEAWDSPKGSQLLARPMSGTRTPEGSPEQKKGRCC